MNEYSGGNSPSQFKDWFGSFTLRLSYNKFLISLFPVKVFSLLGDFIGYSIFLLNYKYRKTILENLTVAFGNRLNCRKLRKICLQNIRHIVKGFVELIYFPLLPEKTKRKFFTIEGKEYLDYALSLKKGVIGVTCHIGNFVIMGAGLKLEGYPINFLIRPLMEKRIDNFTRKMREDAGVGSIYTEPPKECVDNSIRYLRDNKLLIIPMDQNSGRGGVYTRFFNRTVPTPVGPLVFARRTGSPILPIFVVRKGGGQHKIIIKKPIEIKKTNNFDNFVLDYSEKLTRIIEDYIHKYPAQWEWSYKRWN
jgi:KDO2-lipid IV(A) lauroyltransferase